MTAEADEEPAGRRPRGDIWTGVLRADCSHIDNQLAKQLLKEYGDAIHTIARKVQRGLSRVASMGYEDMLVIGQMAVFEAHNTYDAARGGTMRTWVGYLVYWRMSEFLEKASMPDGEIIDHEWAREAFEGNAVDEFEERMDFTEQLRLLAVNFALMPHRTRLILLQRLEGASSGEIAASLGISVFREQQIVGRMRASLRERLQDTMAAGTAHVPEAGTSVM